jgi:hypothetical protein
VPPQAQVRRIGVGPSIRCTAALPIERCKPMIAAGFRGGLARGSMRTRVAGATAGATAVATSGVAMAGVRFVATAVAASDAWDARSLMACPDHGRRGRGGLVRLLDVLPTLAMSNGRVKMISHTLVRCFRARPASPWQRPHRSPIALDTERVVVGNDAVGLCGRPAPRHHAERRRPT